jgi:hypothetical protein
VVGRWIRLVQEDTLRPQAISTATRAAILDRFPTPTLSTIGPSRGPCFAGEEWDERVRGAYGDLRYARLPALEDRYDPDERPPAEPDLRASAREE